MNIEEVWKHIANTVANKVNDPFEELCATIVPITNGEFGEHISSDTPRWQGDSYAMIKSLAAEENIRVSSTFAYYCPCTGKSETGEVLNKALLFALVNKPTSDDGFIHFGMWNLTTNEVDYQFSDDPMSEENDEFWGGELPIALAALSLRASIENDELGELGKLMKESLELAKESFLKFQEVMEKSSEQ